VFDLNVTVNTALRLRNPSLGIEGMRAVALAARDSMRTRILSGVNLYDAPAPALGRYYAAYKTRAGAQPIRNWKLTGALMASMDVTRCTETYLTVGFRGEDQRTKARMQSRGMSYKGERVKSTQWGTRRIGVAWRGGAEPMFGLSPNDQHAVRRAIRSAWIASWIPTHKAA
jgi:hypothetical protein